MIKEKLTKVIKWVQKTESLLQNVQKVIPCQGSNFIYNSISKILHDMVFFLSISSVRIVGLSFLSF